MKSFDLDSQSIQVMGDIDFEGDRIHLKFRLVDDQLKVSCPRQTIHKTGAEISRETELWKATCFEAFLSVPGAEKYYEINLSAKGAWDAYEFSSYRKPSPPHRTADFAIESLSWDQGFLDAQLITKVQSSEWLCGLCSVLVTSDRGSYYFALAHPGSKPDFHSRGGFVLQRKTL